MTVPADSGEQDSAATVFYAALATPAMIGRNLFGERRYRNILDAAPYDSQHVVVGSVGPRRWLPPNPWLVDRIADARLVQDGRTFALLTRHFSPARRLAAEGAPEFDRLARFAIAGRAAGSTRWRRGPSRSTPAGAPMHCPTACRGRWRAARWRRWRTPASANPSASESAAGARARWPTGSACGIDRQWDIAALLVLLAAATAVIVLQDELARSRRLHRAVRVGLLAVVLVWLGWIAGGQLTILTVVSAFRAAIGAADWEVLLLDPLLAIVAAYTAADAGAVGGAACSAAGCARSARCRNSSTAPRGWRGCRKSPCRSACNSACGR